MSSETNCNRNKYKIRHTAKNSKYPARLRRTLCPATGILEYSPSATTFLFVLFSQMLPWNTKIVFGVYL